MHPDEYVDRLRQGFTAAVADVQQGFGILDPEIRTRTPGLVLAGPAFTVKCYPGSIITVHKALTEAQPGDVLVIDGEADGRAGALIGELMSHEAVDRGLAGVVVDGALRDVAGLRELGFPAFARHVTPRVGVNRRLGSTQVPVSVGGVIVQPGDYILGDDDGVAVIPATKIADVLTGVEQVERKERGLLEAIQRHERLVDLLHFGDAIQGQ